MRCKKHPCDLSNSVGVCASCLRERLSALIAAQAQIQQQQQIAQLAKAHHSRAVAAAVIDESRKSDPTPAHPLTFPRSVSPYVARRKSDDASEWSHHHNHSSNIRFYSTPQVGPTYRTTTDMTTISSSGRKKKQSKFSLWSRLFRSRSEKIKTDPNDFGPGVCNSTDSIDAPSSSNSPSWFSTIFTGRRRMQSRQFSMDYSGPVGRKPSRRPDRGMSPVRGVDSDEDCEGGDQSPSGSGQSSASSPGWKRTPVTTGVMRRGKAGHGRNMSGLAFCLSPLVRASPNRHWNQKGGLPPELGFSGDVRIPMKPHLSTAASFCANRSRKLADFGRVNHNR